MLLPAAGVAVLVLLVLRTLVAETFAVTADSMAPTLKDGDRVVVLKTAGIERDDIVVFDGAQLLGLRQSTVKRVIGVPGDEISCCTGGRIVRNGEPLAEPYVTGPTDQTAFEVTVPADRYWVMGDNRADSADSRSALGRPGGGMLRAADVVGEVRWRYWPTGGLGEVQEGGATHTPTASSAGDVGVIGDTSEVIASPTDHTANDKEPAP